MEPIKSHLMSLKKPNRKTTTTTTTNLKQPTSTPSCCCSSSSSSSSSSTSSGCSSAAASSESRQARSASNEPPQPPPRSSGFQGAFVGRRHKPETAPVPRTKPPRCRPQQRVSFSAFPDASDSFSYRPISTLERPQRVRPPEHRVAQAPTTLSDGQLIELARRGGVGDLDSSMGRLFDSTLSSLTSGLVSSLNCCSSNSMAEFSAEALRHQMATLERVGVVGTSGRPRASSSECWCCCCCAQCKMPFIIESGRSQRVVGRAATTTTTRRPTRTTTTTAHLSIDPQTRTVSLGRRASATFGLSVGRSVRPHSGQKLSRQATFSARPSLAIQRRPLPVPPPVVPLDKGLAMTEPMSQMDPANSRLAYERNWNSLCSSSSHQGKAAEDKPEADAPSSNESTAEARCCSSSVEVAAGNTWGRQVAARLLCRLRNVLLPVKTDSAVLETVSSDEPASELDEFIYDTPCEPSLVSVVELSATRRPARPPPEPPTAHRVAGEPSSDDCAQRATRVDDIRGGVVDGVASSRQFEHSVHQNLQLEANSSRTLPNPKRKAVKWALPEDNESKCSSRLIKAGDNRGDPRDQIDELETTQTVRLNSSRNFNNTSKNSPPETDCKSTQLAGSRRFHCQDRPTRLFGSAEESSPPVGEVAKGDLTIHRCQAQLNGHRKQQHQVDQAQIVFSGKSGEMGASHSLGECRPTEATSGERRSSSSQLVKKRLIGTTKEGKTPPRLHSNGLSEFKPTSGDLATNRQQLGGLVVESKNFNNNRQCDVGQSCWPLVSTPNNGGVLGTNQQSTLNSQQNQREQQNLKSSSHSHLHHKQTNHNQFQSIFHRSRVSVSTKPVCGDEQVSVNGTLTSQPYGATDGCNSQQHAPSNDRRRSPIGHGLVGSVGGHQSSINSNNISNNNNNNNNIPKLASSKNQMSTSSRNQPVVMDSLELRCQSIKDGDVFIYPAKYKDLNECRKCLRDKQICNCTTAADIQLLDIDKQQQQLVCGRSAPEGSSFGAGYGAQNGTGKVDVNDGGNESSMGLANSVSVARQLPVALIKASTESVLDYSPILDGVQEYIATVNAELTQVAATTTGAAGLLTAAGVVEQVAVASLADLSKSAITLITTKPLFGKAPNCVASLAAVSAVASPPLGTTTTTTDNSDKASVSIHHQNARDLADALPVIAQQPSSAAATSGSSMGQVSISSALSEAVTSTPASLVLLPAVAAPAKASLLESPKRSIFEGASKDEILEYLEDARERVPDILMAADDVMVISENELIVVNQLEPDSRARQISILDPVEVVATVAGSGPIPAGVSNPPIVINSDHLVGGVEGAETPPSLTTVAILTDGPKDKNKNNNNNCDENETETENANDNEIEIQIGIPSAAAGQTSSHFRHLTQHLKEMYQSSLIVMESNNGRHALIECEPEDELEVGLSVSRSATPSSDNSENVDANNEFDINNNNSKNWLKLNYNSGHSLRDSSSCGTIVGADPEREPASQVAQIRAGSERTTSGELITSNGPEIDSSTTTTTTTETTVTPIESTISTGRASLRRSVRVTESSLSNTSASDSSSITGHLNAGDMSPSPSLRDCTRRNSASDSSASSSVSAGMQQVLLLRQRYSSQRDRDGLHHHNNRQQRHYDVRDAHQTPSSAGSSSAASPSSTTSSPSSASASASGYGCSSLQTSGNCSAGSESLYACSSISSSSPLLAAVCIQQQQQQLTTGSGLNFTSLDQPGIAASIVAPQSSNASSQASVGQPRKSLGVIEESRKLAAEGGTLKLVARPAAVQSPQQASRIQSYLLGAAGRRGRKGAGSPDEPPSEFQCLDCDQLMSVAESTPRQTSLLFEDQQEIPVRPAADQLDRAYVAAMNGLPLCRSCEKKRIERKEIISEFVDTELKYGRDLKIIHDEFYRPTQVAGLLTKEQVNGIFLNLEELIMAHCRFAERLERALEEAHRLGDHDYNTLAIGRIFNESAEMLNTFESYCVRQGSAACLLARLDKEKELLRVFLRVSQMENSLLRRMNLAAFLMVPVQRVTKYPLLLNRLYKVTAYHHKDREALRDAQLKVELHLEHINEQTKGVGATSKIWRRISSLSTPISAATNKRRLNAEDLGYIKMHKAALESLKWPRDETQFIHSGRLHLAPLTEFLVRQKMKSVRYMNAHALLVVMGRPNWQYRPDLVKSTLDQRLMTPAPGGMGIREAALLLFREKGGRFVVCHEPLLMSNCILSTDCSQFNSECPISAQQQQQQQQANGSSNQNTQSNQNNQRTTVSGQTSSISNGSGGRNSTGAISIKSTASLVSGIMQHHRHSHQNNSLQHQQLSSNSSVAASGNTMDHSRASIVSESVISSLAASYHQLHHQSASEALDSTSVGSLGSLRNLNGYERTSCESPSPPPDTSKTPLGAAPVHRQVTSSATLSSSVSTASWTNSQTNICDNQHQNQQYSHFFHNHHQPYGDYEESFEIHDRLTKESLLLRADTTLKTRYWLQMLRYHAKDLGQWRHRRPALANIMMMRQD